MPKTAPRFFLSDRLVLTKLTGVTGTAESATRLVSAGNSASPSTIGHRRMPESAKRKKDEKSSSKIVIPQAP